MWISRTSVIEEKLTNKNTVKSLNTLFQMLTCPPVSTPTTTGTMKVMMLSRVLSIPKVVPVTSKFTV